MTQIVPFHGPQRQTSLPSSAPGVTNSSPRLASATVLDSATSSSPRLELSESILPVGSILAQLQQQSLWREAAHTVAVLVWDSALGGGVGWLVNYVFSFGNFLSGQSAQHQTYASFCAGVMGITSVILASTMLVAQAASMLQLHFTKDPSRTPTLLACAGRLVRYSFGSFLVSFSLVVSSAYGIASLPAATHAYKLHFYIGGLFINLYTTSLDLAHRRVFQQETVEGQLRTTSFRSGSHIAKVLRLMVKDFLLTFTVYLAAIYIHVSTLLRLETAQELFRFSVASYVFKLLTQEITKNVVLHQKKTHAKTIYIAVAVPTVLIDTQIRSMILRQPNIKQSMAGSVALAVVEMFFRFGKVWVIRLEIWLREKRVVRLIVRGPNADQSNGPSGPMWWKRGSVDVSSTRITVQDDPRYVEFLHWRRRLLRFHAAEIHADMYAEYLAIVCSMSIYYFYHEHPKYATHNSSSSTKSALSGLKQQAAYLCVQIAMEMVVDFMSCLWELVNGVPMQNSKKMRGFIAALFVCCSVTNIVLSATIYIKTSD